MTSSATAIAGNPIQAPGQQQGQAPLQLVGMTAGGRKYALPIIVVQEINRTMPIEKTPDTPDFTEGVVNLRGQMIPVVDLGKRLSATPNQTFSGSRIVFVELPYEQPNTVVGLAVEKVCRVLRLDPAAVEPNGESAQHPAVDGVGRLGEEVLLLLSPNRLFAAEELAAMRGASRVGPG
ncbi:MAG: chemotaxis protein CheW [Planctomycetota bacterium]